ncbi:hypothetical protein MASR1M60_14090 [Rhodocyclaceae bacterium]
MNNTSKKWREKNPDGQEGYNINRKIRESQAGVGVTDADIRRVRMELGDRCAYCDAPLKGSGVVDHIIPIRQGGANTAENITLACWKCNGDKHSKTPEEFLSWRKRSGLPVRSDINWQKYRLPITDDGVVELLISLLADGASNSKYVERGIRSSLSLVKANLLNALNRFPYDEQTVIRLRYGIDCQRVTVLWYIADKLGCSQASVSSIYDNALNRLKISQEIRAIRYLLDSTANNQQPTDKLPLGGRTPPSGPGMKRK